MADEENTQSPKAARPEKPGPYIGVSPEYQNSATDSTSPLGKPDEIAKRVSAAAEANKVAPADGDFKAWKKEHGVGNAVTRASKS